MAIEVASDEYHKYSITTNTHIFSVIRVLIQFLKENRLTDTARMLQNEAKIQMNCLENRTEFSKLVSEGKWDQVLQQTSDLSLSEECNFQLYEQVRLFLLISSYCADFL